MVEKNKAQLNKFDCDAGDNYIPVQETITILLKIKTFIFHRVQTVT